MCSAEDWDQEGCGEQEPAPFLEPVEGCPGGKVPPGPHHHSLSDSPRVDRTLVSPRQVAIWGDGSGSWLVLGSLFRPLPWHVDFMCLAGPLGMLGTPKVLLAFDSLGLVLVGIGRWDFHPFCTFLLFFLPFLVLSLPLPFLS